MILLITMGDPVGIGPEIIARAFQRGAADGAVVVADVGAMRRAMALFADPWPIARIESLRDLSQCPPRCLPVWQPEGLPSALDRLAWGAVDARAGKNLSEPLRTARPARHAPADGAE